MIGSDNIPERLTLKTQISHSVVLNKDRISFFPPCIQLYFLNKTTTEIRIDGSCPRKFFVWIFQLGHRQCILWHFIVVVLVSLTYKEIDCIGYAKDCSTRSINNTFTHTNGFVIKQTFDSYQKDRIWICTNVNTGMEMDKCLRKINQMQN